MTAASIARVLARARDITLTEAINISICVCAVIGLIAFSLWIEELQNVFPIRND
ncbi:hypothetical protein IZ6_12240 [Terrihabitans soli]|uniref:Uncharacterized protein n=1 Tax=Terrihabitans soli TaxID=708113 RepID=A0A6S6QNF6_9HYPH|nr:hypothetical protein [Terrihabitans soli]BCJ90489.1 hypothetical protein IZ6_12240 [Terrihabitans soli]